MSTTTTAFTTTDILPSSVPKRLPTGLNWTAFSIRFQEAIEAKGFWGHFDGTSPKPTLTEPPVTGEQNALRNQWLKGERSAKALLTHHIPDSTFIPIHAKESLMDSCNLTSRNSLRRALLPKLSCVELRTRFMYSKYPDKGNVREFLDELRVEKSLLRRRKLFVEVLKTNNSGHRRIHNLAQIGATPRESWEARMVVLLQHNQDSMI
jgi:hypothetical protein